MISKKHTAGESETPRHPWKIDRQNSGGLIDQSRLVVKEANTRVYGILRCDTCRRRHLEEEDWTKFSIAVIECTQCCRSMGCIGPSKSYALRKHTMASTSCLSLDPILIVKLITLFNSSMTIALSLSSSRRTAFNKTYSSSPRRHPLRTMQLTKSRTGGLLVP